MCTRRLARSFSASLEAMSLVRLRWDLGPLAGGSHDIWRHTYPGDPLSLHTTSCVSLGTSSEGFQELSAAPVGSGLPCALAEAENDHGLAMEARSREVARAMRQLRALIPETVDNAGTSTAKDCFGRVAPRRVRACEWREHGVIR